MNKSLARKTSIILGVSAMVFAVLSFVMFFINRAFVISLGTNSTFSNLFKLGFGGTWDNSSTGEASVFTYNGSTVISISFLFIAIAIIIGGVLLHDILRKKFSYKTNISLASVALALLVLSTIGLCFTKRIAANSCSEAHGIASFEIIYKNCSFTPVSIICIVSGVLSSICFIGYITHSAIEAKKSK